MERGEETKEREAELKPLRQRLERWRSVHKGRRLRIPKELWEQSARAACKHGVAAVSKGLRLDYYSLKSRLDRLPRAKKTEEKLLKFVELIPPPMSKSSANAIELQKAGGSKLRIEFEGELTRELSRLSERLWRAAR